MADWWRKNWPWILPIGWLFGYEVYALITRIPGSGLYRPPMLSQIVWHAAADNPWLVWVVTPIVVVLWVHFFVRRNR